MSNNYVNIPCLKNSHGRHLTGYWDDFGETPLGAFPWHTLKKSSMINYSEANS